ncbi:hypothetical protein F2Q70_00039712 [Brassica cretica]|uniref:NPR1/NIM1-like C-terminal domain-containing protein n=1 Tax=Brassica cretica TaxID=69181 RepID=A0A8S9K6Q9_BRACR|nr:hypothetical protein F2Q70_00039712 [Brassica cretica]
MALDGRTALLIAKQVTKAGEYNCITEEGKDSPKGRLCVEILEQPENLGPFPEDASSACLALAPDAELKIRLIDFENRVQMARCLFPTEAQLAMELAPMKGTSEFTVDSQELDGTGAKRSAPDQYMVPFVFEEKHRSRLEALSKTVEFGRRFFPRCSTLLDKIADCETLSILAFVEKDTPENRVEKRQKYMEIQESLLMAFSKDNEEFGKSSRSGSSSSTSKSTKRSNDKPSVLPELSLRALMRASRSDLLIVSSWVVLMIEQPLNLKVFPSPAATEFMGRGHGTTYYKQLLEKNKQYIQEPATVEKCQELSKQLLYTRLASIPGRTESFWKEVDHVKGLWKNRADLKVEDAGIAALFGLECFAWYCAGEIVGRGFTFTGYYP